MPENITNELIYEVLKSIQDDIAHMRRGFREIDRRFDAIERSQNGLRIDIAALSDLTIDQREGYRKLTDRVSRIERRLEIHDQTDA